MIRFLRQLCERIFGLRSRPPAEAAPVRPLPPFEPVPFVPPAAAARWREEDPRALMRYWAFVLGYFDLSELRGGSPLPGQIDDPAKAGTNDEPTGQDEVTDALLVFFARPGKRAAGIPLVGFPVRRWRTDDGQRFSVSAPYQPVVNFSYLGPNIGRGCFGIAEREHAEGLLSRWRSQFPDNGVKHGWLDYWAAARSFFLALLSQETMEGAEQHLKSQSGTDADWSITYEAHPCAASYFTKAMQDAYARFNGLSDHPERFALVRTIASQPRGEPLAESCREPLLAHCGHMDEFSEGGKRSLFALDTTQRRAVRAAVRLTHGQVIAVNGPPGAGKTAMLRSLIASEWISAASNNRPCPIIVAVGATNQSVTNVIKAFSKAAHPDDSFLLAARWIPVKSYGAYIPRGSLFRDLSSPKNAAELESLEDYILLVKQDASSAGSLALYRYYKGLDPLDPDSLPELEQEFLARAERVFAGRALSVEATLEACHRRLEETLRGMHEQLRLTVGLTEGTKALIAERAKVWTTKRIESVRVCSAELEHEGSDAEKHAEQKEALVDLTWRAEALYWACHYWEARFLLAQREALITRHPENVEEALRRICMLTPCVVSTFNTLPNLLSATSGGSDDIQGSMAEVIDLLVLDESGQAAPHLAGLAAAFSKRAVAVGDVKQLAPIVNLPCTADEQLARTAGITDYAGLVRSGRHAFGTALGMLRVVSAFHDVEGFAQGQRSGLSLLYHYRCYPTIIGYSNALSYENRLRMRTKDPQDPFLPSLGWVPSAKEPMKSRGSWLNEPEIETLVSWIIDQWPAWVARYPARPKYEIVAVVTAYRPQADTLSTRLSDAFQKKAESDTTGLWPTRKEVKRFVIGTVHQLQGAECPIVCFSLVEGPAQAGVSFIDRDNSLMNVAVSRAQEAFILFAHPGRIFGEPGAKPSQPVAFLGWYIRSSRPDGSPHGRRLFPRRVVVVESPNKVAALSRLLGRDYEVHATAGAIHSLPIGAVDIGRGFIPALTLERSKVGVIERIAQAVSREVDELVIATDDDRMGEFIGWMVGWALRGRIPSLKVSRWRLGAINAAGIANAKNDATFINEAVCAEAARIVLDALFTSHISERIRGGRAVGRVMAAVLRTLADLETKAAEAARRLVPTLQVFDGRTVTGFFTTEPSLSDGAKVLFKPRGEVQRLEMPAAPPTASTMEIMKRAVQRGHAPWETAEALQSLFDGSWQSEDGAKGNEAGAHLALPDWGRGHPPVHVLDPGLEPGRLVGQLSQVQQDVYSIIYDIGRACRTADGAARTYPLITVSAECSVHYASDGPEIGRVRFAASSCPACHKGFAPEGSESGDLAVALQQSLAAPIIEGVVKNGAMRSATVRPVELLRAMETRRLGRPSTYGDTLFRLASDKTRSGRPCAPLIEWSPDRVSLTLAGRDMVAELQRSARELSDPSTTTGITTLLDKVERGEILSNEVLAMHAGLLGWHGDLAALKARTWSTLPEFESVIQEGSPEFRAGLIGSDIKEAS